MQQSDKMEFFTAVSIANASYGKALDEFMLASWWECMNGYDLISIKQALLMHAGTKDGGFAPKPCHIKEQIDDNTIQPKNKQYAKPATWED